jgi:hypothetical protein
VSTKTGGIDFIGANLFEEHPMGRCLHTSELSDTWRQNYANLHLKQSRFFLDGNLYHSQDYSEAVAGAIDNTAYSLLGKYTACAQTFTSPIRKLTATHPLTSSVATPSTWPIRSSMPISTVPMNAHGRCATTLTSTFGLPGLKFMTRYVTGRGIDGTQAPKGGAYNPFDPYTGDSQPQQRDGGRHWEHDIDLHYLVQSGPAKNFPATVPCDRSSEKRSSWR